MKCESVQEWILSDYFDSELSEEMRKKIDQHLTGCKNCQVFVGLVQEHVIEPFKEMATVEPPPEMWQELKHRIERQGVPEEQTYRQETHVPLWQRIKDFVSFPLVLKPAFGLVGLALLTGLIFFQWKAQDPIVSNQSTSPTEKQETVAFVAEEYVSMTMTEDDGFGTFFEVYFL